MKARWLVGGVALVLLLSGGWAVTAFSHDVEFGPKARALPSNGIMYGWIRKLWGFGAESEAGYRELGTEASDRAAEYVRQRFEALGLQVEVDEMEVPTVFRPFDWSFAVETAAGSESLPAYPMQYTAPTGPEGVAADLVYVGEGSEEEFAAAEIAGKIVVVDIRMPRIPWAITKPTSYLNYDPDGTLPPGYKILASGVRPNLNPALDWAIEGGAVGFIGILKDLPAAITDHFGPYNGNLRPIPALWLDSATGSVFRDLLLAGAARGELTLQASVESGTARSIIGVLPGKTDDIVLVESHVDGWAVNDASGVSVVLALAEYFVETAPPEGLEKTLMFVTTNRFHGGLGAQDFVDRHQDLLPKIVTMIAVEHIGKDYVAEGTELVDTGMVAPRIIWVSPDTPLVPYTVDAVVGYDLQRTTVQPAGQDAIASMWDPPRPIGESSPYYLAGVPVIAYFSWPITLFTTEHDTPDKVAVDELRPLTAAFAEIIERIDATPVEEIRP